MRNNLSNIARAGSAYPSIAHILLNKDNRHLVKHFAKSVFTVLVILIVGGIGVQTFTSCSSGSDDDPPPGGGGGGDTAAGNGEGMEYAYAIEDLNETSHSFKIIDKTYNCFQGGELEERTSEAVIDYSINGNVLSFTWPNYSSYKFELNGNSTSIIGTWTKTPFVCTENCDSHDGVSKAVFTQSSLTFLHCVHKLGVDEYLDDDGVAIRNNVIDCGTIEITKGTETVRATYSGTDVYLTYRGKTCKQPSKSQFYSKEAKEKACKEAYETNGDYYEILSASADKCLKDNNFPEWL